MHLYSYISITAFIKIGGQFFYQYIYTGSNCDNTCQTDVAWCILMNVAFMLDFRWTVNGIGGGLGWKHLPLLQDIFVKMIVKFYAYDFFDLANLIL